MRVSETLALIESVLRVKNSRFARLIQDFESVVKPNDCVISVAYCLCDLCQWYVVFLMHARDVLCFCNRVPFLRPVYMFESNELPNIFTRLHDNRKKLKALSKCC